MIKNLRSKFDHLSQVCTKCALVKNAVNIFRNVILLKSVSDHSRERRQLKSSTIGSQLFSFFTVHFTISGLKPASFAAHHSQLRFSYSKYAFTITVILDMRDISLHHLFVKTAHLLGEATPSYCRSLYTFMPSDISSHASICRCDII